MINKNMFSLSQEEKNTYLQQNDKLKDILATSPLFDDKHLQNMYNSLSDEDKLNYKKIGEHMYNSIDFSEINSQGLNDNHKEIDLENVSQLKLMLQSGIHPSYLSNQDKDLLKNNLGEKWYEKFGFLENDLNRINF